MTMPTPASATLRRRAAAALLLLSLIAAACVPAVDLRELQTGIAQRDGYIQTNTLATGRFPTAEFAPVQAAGLPAPLPAAGEHRFTLTGPMTLHGVQKEVTWDVTATRQESTVAGLARTSITFADFGLTAPRLPFLHSVAEEIALEVSVAAVAAPPPTGSAQMPAPRP